MHSHVIRNVLDEAELAQVRALIQRSRFVGGSESAAGAAEQVKTNPARFQSALSMLEGEILLIPGGTPLIIDNVVVGGVGSAGHRGDGDVRAVKAAIAAWEKFRQSRR